MGLKLFRTGYLEAANFCHDPNSGTVRRLPAESAESCADFYASNSALWCGVLTDVQAGRCFYLSRSGHGTGFFDSGIRHADELQKRARVYRDDTALDSQYHLADKF